MRRTDGHGFPMLGHLAAILTSPERAWQAIASDPIPAGRLIAGLVIPLALIPGIATGVGIRFFNMDWDFIGGYAPPPDMALKIGTANFAFAVLTVLLLALILRTMAGLGSATPPGYVDALKIAAFGSAPVLFASSLLVVPVLVIVPVVALLYSLFVMQRGLRIVIGIRDDEASILLAVAIVLLTLGSAVIGALVSALGLA